MTLRKFVLLGLVIAAGAGCSKTPAPTSASDTTAPMAVIVSPVNGSTLVGDTTYRVIIDVHDRSGIRSVTFTIDGATLLVDSLRPFECAWSTAGLAGIHTIGAVVVDSAGNETASNVITVRVTIRSRMVRIAGGTYIMGDGASSANARPAHTVTVGSFSMDENEVTFEKWNEVRTWALAHGYADLGAGQNGYAPAVVNNPVTNVTWYDAVKWCNARSEMDGLTPVYYTHDAVAVVYRTGTIDPSSDEVLWTANGFRLPTEAEWEYAARGGTNSKGYLFSGGNAIDAVAWTSLNSNNSTHPVRMKTANELGLYDMSGNVWEWCWDLMSYPYAYQGGAQINPKGQASGTVRSMRGGAFDAGTYGLESFQITSRNAYAPSNKYVTIGLRCVSN